MDLAFFITQTIKFYLIYLSLIIRKLIIMKQRNFNSNKKNNPTQNYGSTYSIESEQKDLLLSKMKAEFDGLKKNEQ